MKHMDTITKTDDINMFNIKLLRIIRANDIIISK